METKAKKIMYYYKLDGVKDIEPMKSRGLFAKALMVEDAAGHTTLEAVDLLEQAITALD